MLKFNSIDTLSKSGYLLCEMVRPPVFYPHHLASGENSVENKARKVYNVNYEFPNMIISNFVSSK